MPESPPQSFEEVVDRARLLDVPLAERLRYVAHWVRVLSPAFADAVDVFVGRLEAVEAGRTAPKVGDPMPDFLLPDEAGRLTSLGERLAEAPQVVVIHRGHWCPYCRVTMAGVAAIQDQVAPARLVTISPERAQYTKVMKADSGIRFPMLTDAGAGYIFSLGLAVLVEDAMAALIAAGGRDVPTYQGTVGWVLPIPAMFVVGQDGIIRAAHVDPDYRSRMEPAAIIAAVRASF